MQELGLQIDTAIRQYDLMLWGRNYPRLYSKDVTQRIHVEAGFSEYSEVELGDESQEMGLVEMPESVPYSSR